MSILATGTLTCPYCKTEEQTLLRFGLTSEHEMYFEFSCAMCKETRTATAPLVDLWRQCPKAEGAPVPIEPPPHCEVKDNSIPPLVFFVSNAQIV